MADTFAEELIDDLALTGLGTKATDLFFNHMPDIAANCVCLYDNGGMPFRYSNFNTVRIGVRVRASTYVAAAQLAGQVLNRFHTRIGYALEDSTVLAGTADGLPESIGVDDTNKRHLVVFGFTFTTILTSQVNGDQSSSSHPGKGGIYGPTPFTPFGD